MENSQGSRSCKVSSCCLAPSLALSKMMELPALSKMMELSGHDRSAERRLRGPGGECRFEDAAVASTVLRAVRRPRPHAALCRHPGRSHHQGRLSDCVYPLAQSCTSVNLPTEAVLLCLKAASESA